MEEKKREKLLTWIAIITVVLGVAFMGIMYFKLSDSGFIYTEVNDSIDTSNLNFSFIKFENNQTNLIYSPLSIKTALSMLNDGADGKTKEEIEKVLNKTKVYKYSNMDDKFSIANAMFIKNQYKDEVYDSYINRLNEAYNAEINYDEFTSYDNLNNWTKDKTMGQIDKVFDGTPDVSLFAILINALAINMEWDKEFSFDNTNAGKFIKANDEEIDATMMHNTYDSNSIKYYSNDNITSISLDLAKYNDKQFEFMLIMPNSNLNEYINEINETGFDNVYNNLVNPTDYNKINLSIPKFSYNSELKFIEDLNKLGIINVFTENANLSKITSESIFVNDAVHKANIDFSEKGIKASAVTAFQMFKNSAKPIENNILSININKPFIYFILDKDTKDIIFIGSLYEPNLWSNDEMEYRK